MVIHGEECMAPLPDSEYLWNLHTASEWQSEFELVHTFSDGQPALGRAFTPSLRQLFCLYYINKTPNLTPFQLRALLCHVQDFILRSKSLDKFEPPTPGVDNWSDGDEVLGRSRAMYERARLLLNRWHEQAERYLEREEMCAEVHAALVMYHLVHLAAITEVPEIEELARCGRTNPSRRWNGRPADVVIDFEGAIYHCGRALGLLKRMDLEIRPPWWVGAVYRTCIILWYVSITNFGTCVDLQQGEPAGREGETLDPIDAMGDGVRSWSFARGTPVLTPVGGGLPVRLPDQSGVLRHAVEVVEAGLPSRFGDAICDKLGRLADEFRGGREGGGFGVDG